MHHLDYFIGVDYGTDSVRSVIVDARGNEIASSVFYYPRWKQRLYCDASTNRFRQHPLDYIEGLEQSVRACISSAGEEVAKNVRAISIDTTGSTPVAVDKKGTPLALLPGFEENPNAMFVLWEDHTAVDEAAEINHHATNFDINYLKYCGGLYSSEWFWAKLLHILREDKEVRDQCYSWVEHCDWIPFLLTGGNDVQKMKRSTCAAGHKALWASEWDGLPPEKFFSSLDPLLSRFRERLFHETYPSDVSAGNLSSEWAARLGLSTDVRIGVGAFDAHMGAVGGQIEPYHLSKVMGTSTCDMMVVPSDTDVLVRGICGQVPGSIIPGMLGLEAGQSAFGDAYSWFTGLLSWSVLNVLPDGHSKSEIETRIIRKLEEKAAGIQVTEESELSVDWLNGRRTPEANQMLKGAITGLDLGSDAASIYRSLVEATCFGAKAIVDRFGREGVPVKGVIGLGGVARKSPFVMQMMADVLNMPIRVHKSDQTCASGAAMFAAVVAGVYPNVEKAMEAMGQGFDKLYEPAVNNSAIYQTRYQKYLRLGEFIENTTMKESLSGAPA